MRPDWGFLARKIIRIAFLLFLSIACLGIMVAAGRLLLSWNPQIIWEPQQKRLAAELGINIKDYPNPRIFPEGYFEAKLIPGTDISEVHRRIKGFSKVVNCRTREVYYFFDAGEDFSLRIEVLYNADFTVKKIQGEDEDDRTINVSACSDEPISE
jgi:hypothetical protein